MTLSIRPRYFLYERVALADNGAAYAATKFSLAFKFKFEQFKRLLGSTRLPYLKIPVETFTPPYRGVVFR